MFVKTRFKCLVKQAAQPHCMPSSKAAYWSLNYHRNGLCVIHKYTKREIRAGKTVKSCFSDYQDD